MRLPLRLLFALFAAVPLCPLSAVAAQAPSAADVDSAPQEPTPAQKSLMDMMAFVDRAGALSGAVGTCSEEESHIIDGCANLVLSNWKQLTGEKPVDITGIKSVFRAAWKKRKAEGASAFTSQKAMSCSALLQAEKSDELWGICLRPDISDAPGGGDSFHLN